jgi:hypothetical protein
MDRVFEGRTARLYVGYGPIHFDGGLDDETPIIITYLHEELEPAIEIKVSSDLELLPTSLWNEHNIILWRKVLPHAQGHDASYIYPPSEIIKMVEHETGLKIIVINNAHLNLIPPNFKDDLKKLGFFGAIRMQNTYKKIRAERRVKDLVYQPDKEV